MSEYTAKYRCSVEASFKLLAAIFILVLAFSCSRGITPQSVEAERQQIDSLIKECADTTALQELVKQFRSQGNILGQGMASLRLGIMQRETSHFMDAIETHHQGYDYARQAADTLGMIQHLNNIGTNFRRMGILDEAATYHYRALTLCEANSDTSFTARKNRVVSLNGIGNVQLTLGNMEAADSAFRTALRGERDLGSALGQAINCANIGSIFESHGMTDSARIYYKMSLDYNREANSNLGISLCHNHFGRLYENERQWDKAHGEYMLAYSLMNDGPDKWHWLEACLALGRISIKMGDLTAARNYIDRAMATAHKIHSLEYLSETYNLYYLLYDKLGDNQKALTNYIKSRNYADSLSIEKTASHMQNVRVRYERDTRQKEFELLQSNYDSERRMHIFTLIAFSVIAVLFLMFAGALWYVNRARAAKNRLMKQLEITRGNFFTNITHEFRTPLTAILGLSASIAEGNMQGEELRKAAGVIARQGHGLLELVNQLLEISKVKSQIGEPDWHYGNIVDYVKMMVESYRPSAQGKKVNLVFSSMHTKVEIVFAPDYIRKIVGNLLSNALKYSDSGGNIYVELFHRNNNITLRVSDEGVGMSNEVITHIFEPFYVGDNSCVEARTGVGLSLVRLLVEALDGKIKVNSMPGKGSVFTVMLPVKESVGTTAPKWEKEEIAADAANSGEQAVTPPTSAEASCNAPVILIVEDNNDIAYYIGSQLSKEYELVYACNGKDGFEKAEQLVPDLIVTDIMMPEMDGFEMSRKIRESRLVSHVPIIAITAKAADEDKYKGLAAGVDAYMTKPFNSNELAIRVTKLLEQRRLLREKYSATIVEGKFEDTVMSQSDKDFLRKFVDYIHKSLSESNNVDISECSLFMCLSPRQFSRKISALTGSNPTNYINRIKISRAKQLLDTHPELPIADISSKCGYDDSSYFTRTFKQIEGLTPTQYKNRVK